MASFIPKRFQNLDTVIASVCNISGAPGLSYGVLYEGVVAHTGNFGYRDVEAQLPTNSDTVYYIGSLTKAFTAAAIGVLVENGEITWDTRIRDILGNDFHFSDPSLTDQMSVLDVLSHRMGLQRSNQLWYGNDNELMIEKSDTIAHIRYLKAVQPFRGTVHYSNWGYALAGEIIEKLSGESWGNYLQTTLLEPLQMNRTACRHPSRDDNVAKPYTVLDDRSFQLLPAVQVRDGTIMGSSQSVTSTVNDMLKWCGALILAHNDQQKTGQSSTPGSPLKQIPKQVAAHTAFAKPYDQGSSYGMGWVCAKLPAPLGAVGCNPGFVKAMPVVGRGSDKLVIYHQGSMSGYTSSIFLVPETESALVVLSNSISLNDCADWVGQLLLEALLNVENPNAYHDYARESAEAHLAKFPEMRKSLEATRVKNTKPKSKEAYLGKFYNQIGDFFIEISTDHQSGTLQLAFQGRESQVWKLEHYHHDTFLWLMSRDEAVKRARFPYAPEKLYKLEFLSNEDGTIDSLLWNHDADGPPEEFFKDVSKAAPTISNSTFDIQKPLAFD